MRTMTRRVALAFAFFAALTSDAAAQSPDLYASMHWRTIGPTRAGRTRALDGVKSQPNVFYIGFDNGGLWRSTDYGSNWEPLFDRQTTGSIGAIDAYQTKGSSTSRIVVQLAGSGVLVQGTPPTPTAAGTFR